MFYDVFPTPVAFYELGRSFTAEESSFLMNQEVRKNIGNKTSTNVGILNSAELSQLKEFIESSVKEYVAKVYAPQDDVNLKITQSWVNYTDKNEHHHAHNHANSFISGVLYIQTDKEQDKIFFYRHVYEPFKFSNQTPTAWTSGSTWFSAVPGQLVLFPSSLVHGVEPVSHDQTRVSLSFNTFPFGILGDVSGLTAININGVDGVSN